MKAEITAAASAATNVSNNPFIPPHAVQTMPSHSQVKADAFDSTPTLVKKMKTAVDGATAATMLSESAVNSGANGKGSSVLKAEITAAASAAANVSNDPAAAKEKPAAASEDRKWAIGTYCEGPHPRFADGLLKLMRSLGNSCRFRATVISDNDPSFVRNWTFPDIIPLMRELDATKSKSFDNIDVACVIAPYSLDVRTTLDLNRGIVEAIKRSNVQYLFLGCRFQPKAEHLEWGRPKLYEAFFNAFELISVLRPSDRMSLCEGYAHYFTAKGVKPDPLRNHKSNFMYACFFRCVPKSKSSKADYFFFNPDLAPKVLYPLTEALNMI